MRAFIAGATGYTGQEVVRQWASRYGADAVAHIRPDSASAEAHSARFAACGASVDRSAWEVGAIEAALETHAVDVVFALLGTTRKRGEAAKGRGQVETYQTVDYGLTVLLFEAMKKVRPGARFVYLSSMGASDGSAYLRARWQVENVLQQSECSHIIARPSFVTGSDRKESRPLERVGAAVADGTLSLLSRIGGRRLAERYRSIDACALASALISAAHGAERQLMLEADQLQALAKLA